MSNLDLDAIEARAIEALQRMDGSEGVVECNTPGLRAIAKASYALSADIPALVARVRELEAENERLRAELEQAENAAFCECGRVNL